MPRVLQVLLQTFVASCIANLSPAAFLQITAMKEQQYELNWLLQCEFCTAKLQDICLSETSRQVLNRRARHTVLASWLVILIIQLSSVQMIPNSWVNMCRHCMRCTRYWGRLTFSAVPLYWAAMSLLACARSSKSHWRQGMWKNSPGALAKDLWSSSSSQLLDS